MTLTNGRELLLRFSKIVKHWQAIKLDDINYLYNIDPVISPWHLNYAWNVEDNWKTASSKFVHQENLHSAQLSMGDEMSLLKTVTIVYAQKSEWGPIAYATGTRV